MTFNQLKTNSTKLAHYRLKIRKVTEFFDVQSLMQHPFSNLCHLKWFSYWGGNNLLLYPGAIQNPTWMLKWSWNMKLDVFFTVVTKNLWRHYCHVLWRHKPYFCRSIGLNFRYLWLPNPLTDLAETWYKEVFEVLLSDMKSYFTFENF